jgi:tRNA U34 5-carboxymethylaminomethyl modifying GTPase MnmE/TrmE
MTDSYGDGEMTSDNEFKKEVREGLSKIDSRVSVLEHTAMTHAGIIEELKRMFFEFESRMNHQAELASERQRAMVQHFESRLESLNSVIQSGIKASFAEHEVREAEAQAKIVAGNDTVQKQILASIVGLLITVLGAVGYFLLERVQLSP